MTFFSNTLRFRAVLQLTVCNTTHSGIYELPQVGNAPRFSHTHLSPRRPPATRGQIGGQGDITMAVAKDGNRCEVV